MRKYFLAVAFFSVAALAWAANDTPWKDKPYDQWDQKDVSKILGDSPWARTLRVDTTWKPAGGANGSNGSNVPGTSNGANTPANQQTANHPAGGTNPGGSGGGQMPASGAAGKGYGGGNNGSNASGGNGGDDNADDSGGASTIFQVRWGSSRVMREAFVRAAELGNHMNAETAAKTLADPITTYQLIVVGPDMSPFVGQDEASLKNDATLQLKKAKKKISPSAVTIQKDGDNVRDVIFEFKRQSDNGEPTIASDEKNVTFECKINKLNLKASFEVPKMADTKGTDL